MADPTSTDPADVAAVDDAVTRSTGTDGYGLTSGGFIPKPFSRILAEKLALSRSLFGVDIDLGSGSALRKILEVSALEDARTWAALAAIYDNQFVATASGEALSRLGEELGLRRPHLEARGTIKLTAQLPSNVSGIALPRGARLLTLGGHHVALDEAVVLSPASPVRETQVVAFYPGPEHNLDPGNPQQKILWWNPADPKLAWDPSSLLSIARSLNPNVAPEALVAIAHTQPLTGGERLWPDARYRDLLLRAPRSIWTVDAIRTAISLVPGVRQVQVRDRIGGVDVDLPIFGTFDFIERLFGAERDLASPYTFDVVVAATDGALWDGPDGLAVAIDAAIEDLRPIGVLPRVQPADPVYVAIQAQLVVKGLPLPRGVSGEVINASTAAVALKQRLLARVHAYIDGLDFGEPVRFSEVMWVLMNEPGVTDVRNLLLVPSPLAPGRKPPDVGDNVPIKPTQIATFVDTDTLLRIV
ncbi:MAG: hypothetical protein E6J91_35435 [Deltaproteobacteria bacterium]|nr:MAG: hypothetical protein E6J91_35435 [Deltaproteobacteria bacterium]